MKRFASVLTLVAIFAIGCASLEHNSYRVIGTTAVTVDAAMNAWGDYVRAGKATDAQQTSVEEAYVRYQSSMVVLKDMVMTYKQSQVKNDSALQAILNVASGTAADLIALIEQFTGKKPGGAS